MPSLASSPEFPLPGAPYRDAGSVPDLTTVRPGGVSGSLAEGSVLVSSLVLPFRTIPLIFPICQHSTASFYLSAIKNHLLSSY